MKEATKPGGTSDPPAPTDGSPSPNRRRKRRRRRGGPKPAVEAAWSDELLLKDQRKLQRLQAAMSNASPSDRAGPQARFDAFLEQATVRAAHRRAARPQPNIDAGLPIAAHTQVLIAAIARHPVVIVAGETGSGKTTQLPQLCVAAGRGRVGRIGCTQPRRIAARAVANRVAVELGTEVGGLVGCKVRFSDQTTEQTLIKFMTDGILLAEIIGDRDLLEYDTLIIDEAHERSLNIDFLLGYLVALRQRRPDLRLIITSATIDTAKFAAHFGQAPIVTVEGRGYPVELRYRPLEPEALTEAAAEELPMVAHILAVLEEIRAEDSRGDVLVFLPGEREIRETHLAIERRKWRGVETLPLYARLSARDQQRVFQPGPATRIVLATNVAETSLTVPRIRYVVDPGLARVKRYSTRARIDRLQIEPISQAAANQRAGRCGRLAPGVCYRLFAETDFDHRPAFTEPEILRTSLAGVILRMLELRFGSVERFAFVDRPTLRAINDGWRQLSELACVDQERRITAIGGQVAKFPVDVALGRMLVAALARGVAAEVAVVASFLSIQDPRERPADRREVADAAHRSFAVAGSDIATIVEMWRLLREAAEAGTQRQLREFCSRHFLSFVRVREWGLLHRQLVLLEPAASRPIASPSANDAVPRWREVHRAVLAGVPTQVGRFERERRQYAAPRNLAFAIHPASPLARRPPPWIMAAVVLETQRIYAREAASISPADIVEVCAHLLASDVLDPRWSRGQGRALVTERLSLFGLEIARRPRALAEFDAAAARELLINEGLVDGEIDLRAGFLADNQRVFEEAIEIEARQRRVGLVIDDAARADFYRARLPDEIVNGAGLDHWYRHLSPAERKRLHWTLDDLLVDEGPNLTEFPAQLATVVGALAVTYRFEPGAPDDGATVSVPLALLSALDTVAFDWPVPGFLGDFVMALLRGLPKALRRHVVPVPDYARAFVASVEGSHAERPLIDELTGFIGRTSGAEVSRSDFERVEVPAHLAFNFRVLDPDGIAMGESRDLADLQHSLAGAALEAFRRRVSDHQVSGALAGMPEEIIPVQEQGPGGLIAWPALVVVADGYAVEVFADQDAADTAHRRAVHQLLSSATQRSRLRAMKQLTVEPAAAIAYAARRADATLPEDLVAAAFDELAEPELLKTRDSATLEAVSSDIERRLFGAALERLALVSPILAALKDLQPVLQPELIGLGRASYDDLQAQLNDILPPDFAKLAAASRLKQLPRWLAAMRQRAEAIARDPSRDQRWMLEIHALEKSLEQAQLPTAERADIEDALQELRVATFAQSLGTPQPVSTKRVARKIAQAANQFRRA